METEFDNIARDIRRLAFEWEGVLNKLSEDEVISRINRQGRNVKHLVGHLIDLASNSHQRIVRLQYTSNLYFPGFSYENDMWISIQQHQQEDWFEMLQLWKYFNLHIAHVISHTDKSWLTNEWSDGNSDPISLKDIIYDYLAHLTLHLNEVNELIESSSSGSREASL